MGKPTPFPAHDLLRVAALVEKGEATAANAAIIRAAADHLVGRTSVADMAAIDQARPDEADALREAMADIARQLGCINTSDEIAEAIGRLHLRVVRDGAAMPPDPLRAYAEFVRDNWLLRTPPGDTALRQLYIMSTGLAGETGEVLEILKKHVRDGVLDREALALELGDVVHYWTRICEQFGMDPAWVLRLNIRKIRARQAKRDLQAVAAEGGAA